MRGLSLFSLVFLVACSQSDTQPNDSGTMPDTHVDLPDTSVDSGQAMDAPVMDALDEEAAPMDAGCGAGYPMGPYGVNVGDVIDNLFFTGLRDTNMNGMFGDEMLETVCLGQYRQNPNVKAVVVIGGAQWCGPCQMEEPQLVTLYAQYQQNGGKVAFLEAMLQNVQYMAPTQNNLVQWGNKYKPTWDFVMDGMQTFLKYNPPQAFPLHIVIEAKSMQIKFEESGSDVPTLQAEIDSVVTGMPFDAGGN